MQFHFAFKDAIFCFINDQDAVWVSLLVFEFSNFKQFNFNFTKQVLNILVDYILSGFHYLIWENDKIFVNLLCLLDKKSKSQVQF